MASKSNFVIRRVNANADRNYLYSLEGISSEILKNPLANNIYQRINRHGGEILIDHNLPNNPRTLGEYYSTNNKIYIYEANHLNVKEVISTLVHESTHIDFRLGKGIKNNSQFEEYRAFCRQYLYEYNTRPSLTERRKIWEFIKIEPDYQKLPLGKNPFGEEEND